MLVHKAATFDLLIPGRMMQVDPMASKYASITPYNYSLNSPALLNDPFGDDVSRGQIERTIRRLWRQAGPNGSATAQIKDYYASGGGGYSPYASGGYRPYGAVEHITPGSGGNWADGWQFSDWSPNGGSATYRALRSQGFVDLGGTLFQVLGGGVLAEVVEENGELYTTVKGGRIWVRPPTSVDPGEWIPYEKKAIAQRGDLLSMAQVATRIQKGGIDTFLEFINDRNYGPAFFLNDIESKVTANSDNLILTLYKPAQPLAWAFKAASWGHENFPNPDFDELRHTLTGYLAVEKWGVETATDLTMGNEMLGLWLDIRTPGPGTAFEWRDVLNNYSGISLWKRNNNAK